MWSTDNFFRLMKAVLLRASQQLGRTTLYMMNIDIVLAKTWKKITLAMNVIEEKKGTNSKPASAEKASWYHQIMDADGSD